MSFKILDSDYQKILNFYKVPIPKSSRLLKKQAEEILATKLCSCIKKVSPKNNESRAIGICTKTVLNRKGFRRGNFSCKKKRQISGLSKTKRRLSIGKKK